MYHDIGEKTLNPSAPTSSITPIHIENPHISPPPAESNNKSPNRQQRQIMDAMLSSHTASVPLLMGGENSAFKSINIHPPGSARALATNDTSQYLDSSTSEISAKQPVNQKHKNTMADAPSSLKKFASITINSMTNGSNSDIDRDSASASDVKNVKNNKYSNNNNNRFNNDTNNNIHTI